MSGNKKSIQDDAEMQKFIDQIQIDPLYKLDEPLSQQAAMDAGKPQLAVSKEPLPPAPPMMGRPLMVYLDAGGNSKFNHYYNSNCNQQNNSINPTYRALEFKYLSLSCSSSATSYIYCGCKGTWSR